MDTESFLTPPLKTQGIKKKLTPWIRKKVSAFPKESRFVEPFMGSGSVSLNMPFSSYLLCDANPHIISFYRTLRDDSSFIQKASEIMLEIYNMFQSDGENAYYFVRDAFNKKHDPASFLILNRSCFNGLMRFNKSGGFNSPFCRNLKRFNKAHRTKVINQMKEFRRFLVKNTVTLIHADFREIMNHLDEKDILYVDPPYIGRNACYYNDWNEQDEADLANILISGKNFFLLSTWHHDRRRENPFIKKYYSNFNVETRDHYYFIGPKEENRYSVAEALISNF